jgi:hypothetical protein
MVLPPEKNLIEKLNDIEEEHDMKGHAIQK